jgi:TIR domain
VIEDRSFYRFQDILAACSVKLSQLIQRKSFPMNDIFVSYSRKDRDVVKRLVEVMEGRGWSVWWDPTIRPGEYYEDVIESALTSSKCVIVVWSKNSVASKWVRAEAAEAANRGVLVPVVIDDARIPFRFKQIQEAQLADWRFTADHPELVRLLDSIAETFIKAQDAPNRQSVSSSTEPEAPTLHPPRPSSPPARKSEPAALEPPINEFQSGHVTGRIDDEFKDNYQEADSADDHPGSRRREIDQQAELNNARATAEVLNAGGQARAPSKSTSRLVIPLLIIIGLAAVGAIYIFAFRGSADTNNDNQAELARQGKAANQQPNANDAPPPTPTPSVTPSPGGNRANALKLAGLLKGKWQSQSATNTDGDCQCASSACLDIQFNRTISDFCVESQVYVSAEFKLDAANNKAYLFFKEPGDVGAGASRMPWDKFDRKKPLATIDLSDLETQRILYVTWHGFTEKGAAKQSWRQIGSGYQGTYLKR